MTRRPAGEVVWSERAVERLAEIEQYIARDDPEAAERWVRKLIDKTKRLERFPHSGRRLLELPESGLRELIVGSYRVVYAVSGSSVTVLTVFEGHRLLPREDLEPLLDP